MPCGRSVYRRRACLRCTLQTETIMAAAHVSARDPRISAFLSPRTPSGTVLAEGTWAHRHLLDIGADIDTFLSCPELLDPPARPLAQAVARHARSAYAVSAKTFARVSHRTSASG